MASLAHDLQLSHLLARARTSPYFDVERAICLAMESWMQERQEAKRSAERMTHGVLHHPTSIVKIFTWPSRELCACVHKGEEDHLYVFDHTQNALKKIESSDPMLQRVEHGDRFILLNDWLHKYLAPHELERLLHEHKEDPDYVLQDELVMHAQVNARSDERVPPNAFHPWVLRVQLLDLEAGS